MFGIIPLFWSIFNKSLYKFQSFYKKDHLVVFILIIFSILLLSFKTTSGQGQGTLLGRALEGYIEETAAFIDLNFEPRENDFFLSQAYSYQEPPADLSQSVFQESFLSPQSILSVFETGQRNQVITYTVQAGDNLSEIARDFGISVNSLVWANNLKDSDYLSPGQELKIPPVSGVIHVVKSGDNVGSIAKKYSADQEKIIEFNSLPKDGSLSIGQELIVPDGKIQVSGQYVAYNSNVRFARLPDLGGSLLVPTQGYNWGRIHGRNGVDVANICGTPIYAASSGSVIGAIEIGWNGGAGKYVKISHGSEIYTLYAHLSKVLVSGGESVARGQLIGLMGSTGLSTGCHLHFEVHGARNPLARY